MAPGLASFSGKRNFTFARLVISKYGLAENSFRSLPDPALDAARTAPCFTDYHLPVSLTISLFIHLSEELKRPCPGPAAGPTLPAAEPSAGSPFSLIAEVQKSKPRPSLIAP